MQINELFDLIKQKQDAKGFSGAISVRDVRVETPDSDTFYKVVNVVYDELRGFYVIQVDV